MWSPSLKSGGLENGAHDLAQRQQRALRQPCERLELAVSKRTRTRRANATTRHAGSSLPTS
jgi:hypothetical protein